MVKFSNQSLLDSLNEKTIRALLFPPCFRHGFRAKTMAQNLKGSSTLFDKVFFHASFILLTYNFLHSFLKIGSSTRTHYKIGFPYHDKINFIFELKSGITMKLLFLLKKRCCLSIYRNPKFWSTWKTRKEKVESGERQFFAFWARGENSITNSSAKKYGVRVEKELASFHEKKDEN